MKFEVVDYVAPVYPLSSVASHTREVLGTLKYDGDIAVLTKADMEECRILCKAEVESAISRVEEVWESEKVALRKVAPLYSVNLPEVVHHIVFVAAHALGEVVYPLDFHGVAHGKPTKPALTACYALHHVMSWFRKAAHIYQLTEDEVAYAREFLSVALMYPQSTSCNTDKCCSNLLHAATLMSVNTKLNSFKNTLGNLLDDFELPRQLNFTCLTERDMSLQRTIPTPAEAEHYLKDEMCRAERAEALYGDLFSPNKYTFRCLLRTEEGPILFGYNTMADFERMCPKFMTLGKAMTEMGIDNETIKTTLTKVSTSGLEGLRVVIYPNDVRFMEPYRRGREQGTISSCMSHSFNSYDCGQDEYRNSYYPLDPYSASYFVGVDNGLALFTLEDDAGTMYSRTIVNVDKMQYVRMYGSHRLARILEQIGIEQDDCTLKDVLIARLQPNHVSGVVGPYLDGDCEYAAVVDSRCLQIGYDGDYWMRDTGGIYYDNGNQVCECCENRMSEEDAYYIEGYGVVCEECYYDLTEEDAVTGDRYLRSNMNEIELDGRVAYVTDSSLEDLCYDDVDDVYYSDGGDMVNTVEGSFTHESNCVQLNDGDWMLSCNYEKSEHGPLMGEDDEEEDAE